jgi:hypothetical protein
LTRAETPWQLAKWFAKGFFRLMVAFVQPENHEIRRGDA